MQNLAWPKDETLRRINAVLLLTILLSNGYVLFAPLLPRVTFEIKQQIVKPVDYTANKNSATNIDRSKNRLIISSLRLEEPIYFGEDISLLNKGLWQRPNTNTPDFGGNTVVVGHRFTYRGNAVFYNLDKLKIGDSVYYVYNQKIYRYVMRSSSVVPATAIEVENATENDQLTLYTCTPIFTAENRLVYVGGLEEIL